MPLFRAQKLRNGLTFACRAGCVEKVKYLLSIGVQQRPDAVSSHRGDGG